MRALRTRAPGKVNLSLFLGPPRPDGLHELVSLVEPLTLADEVRLDPEPGGTADLVVCPGVPGENLAARALAAFRARARWSAPPVRLTITKRVPVAAGMGGGSGDAAAALRLASHAAQVPPELAEGLAPSLGADVPVQLAGRPAVMAGAGERVTPLVRPLPAHHVVVCPSRQALHTADVYREADRLGLPRDPADLTRCAYALDAALATGALPAELLVNDLAPAARSLCPVVDGALERLRRAGADAALVAGSGPTTFGLYRDPEVARAAAAELPDAILAAPAPASLTEVRPA